MKPNFLFVILFFYSMRLCSQNQSNNWYFGDHAGINFNSLVPSAVTNSAMKANEGCGTVSDTATGALLFYTNGVNVWNANHQVMANGAGLLSNFSSSQTGVIVPRPGSSSSYFIFTVGEFYTNGTDGCHYSEVDMILNGGLGGVTTKNILLHSPSSEKCAFTHHANGIDYWVITHDFDTDDFYVYPVTAAGVGPAVMSKAGAGYNGTFNSIACLKISPDGKKLAAALSGNSMVELYDFDPSNGIISNAVQLSPVSSDLYNYGVCFSPGGKYLYSTSENDNNIYQFDLTQSTVAAINASKVIAGMTSSFALQAIQTGPDGKIYITRSGSSYLAVIHKPDLKAPFCQYMDNGVFLGGKTCIYGLPQFDEQDIMGAVYAGNKCLGDTTIFSLLNTANLLAAQWNFDNPATGPNNVAYVFVPVHYYATPGTYNVKTIRYFLNGTSDTLYKQVQIFSNPHVDLGLDTSFCLGASYTLHAGAGYDGYIWHNGSSDSVCTVTTSGSFFVTVFNGVCAAADTINLSTFICTTPSADFSSSDSGWCDKKCIDFFDLSANSPYSWQWYFPGAQPALSNLKNPANICYNNYGTFDVSMVACNIAGCDSIVIHDFIRVFQLPPAPVISQNGDTLFSSPAYSYQWYQVPNPIQGAMGQSYVITQSGSYYVLTRDSNECETVSNTLVVTGINNFSNAVGLSVFPNPNAGSFIIQFSNHGSSILKIEISNDLGQIIFKDYVSHPGLNFSKKFDLQIATAGFYVLKVYSDRSVFTTKILLSK